jgi:HEAT repeat protein
MKGPGESDRPKSVVKRRLGGVCLMLAVCLGVVLFVGEWRRALLGAFWKPRPSPGRLKLHNGSVESLVEALTDEDPYVRLIAGKILVGKPIDNKFVPALTAVLHRDEVGVADQAAILLAWMAPVCPEAVVALIDALKADQPSTRIRAARVMHCIRHSDSVIAPLVIALEDQDLSVRQQAAEGLRILGPRKQEHVPALIRAMKDKDSGVRLSIAYALGELGPDARDAVPVLRDALADEDEHVRRVAAESLPKIGPEAGSKISALAWATKDREHTARLVAVESLANLGPEAKEAIPALRASLRDRDSRVRLEAAYALWKVDGQTEEPVRVLLAILDQERPYVHDETRVMDILGEMGPNAKAAVPRLIGKAEKRHRFREGARAARALKRIDPDAAAAAGIE